MSNLIVVTNQEEVEKDNFYLSNDWTKEVGEETIQRARELQNEDKLFLNQPKLLKICKNNLIVSQVKLTCNLH